MKAESDLASQAVVLEILAPKLHERMGVLKEFISLELYKVYLKLASIGMEDISKFSANEL